MAATRSAAAAEIGCRGDDSRCIAELGELLERVISISFGSSAADGWRNG
jgi:hypothetical protein